MLIVAFLAGLTLFSVALTTFCVFDLKMLKEERPVLIARARAADIARDIALAAQAAVPLNPTSKVAGVPNETDWPISQPGTSTAMSALAPAAIAGKSKSGARLQEWAGPAAWPGTCEDCSGDGWHRCYCDSECDGPFSECQECDGSGSACCQTCDQNGLTLPVRRARLEKTPVNANLLACAFEIVAPAITDPKTSDVWGWRDDEGRVPALRLEGEGWRIVLMPMTEDKP